MSIQTRLASRPHRMPEYSQEPIPAGTGTAWGAFARHYLEMVITAGHLLMLPTMLALMLWRRSEYGHGGHGPSQAEPATGVSAVGALSGSMRRQEMDRA